ncbi:MAG: GNAT family N-acetyltransferase [Candidatus Omnitrophica bacterium]|nr:GNAT family N-acetyltransferase [Candidatus Omnitrophota bacterium]
MKIWPFSAQIIMKIKKSYNIALIFTLIWVVSFVSVSYADSLRLPMGEAFGRIDKAGKFTSSKGEIKIIPLNSKNLEEYKGDIIKLATKNNFVAGGKIAVMRAISKIKNAGQGFGCISMISERMVGYIMCSYTKDELHIDTGVVDRRFDGGGIGNALLLVAAEEAKSKGVSAIIVSVFKASDRLLRFFTNRGFKEVSEFSDNVFFVTLKAPVSLVIEKTIARKTSGLSFGRKAAFNL